MKTDEISKSQKISMSFLENILSDLRRAGIVESQRGRNGGHVLARPANEITIADVMRAEIGNLAAVRGKRPEAVEYEGASENLTKVWVAARAAYRQVLEGINLDEVVNGTFNEQIQSYLSSPDAWKSHLPENETDLM